MELWLRRFCACAKGHKERREEECKNSFHTKFLWIKDTKISTKSVSLQRKIMWVLLAIISGCLLGFYDIAKKVSVRENNVFGVLMCSNIVSACMFLPFVLNSLFGWGWFEGTPFDIPRGSGVDHLKMVVKALIVLSSWICSFSGLKTVPLSVYGPINASRPVFVLLGGILLFGERLNAWQWAGVTVAILSLYLLSMVSKKGEGLDFRKSRGILLVALGTVLGACSALYDKYLMLDMDRVFVQSWFSLYSAVIMTGVFAVAASVAGAVGPGAAGGAAAGGPGAVAAGQGAACGAVACGAVASGAVAGGAVGTVERKRWTKFQWRWSIVLIGVFVSLADFAYYNALAQTDSMISIVSMIRRGSVIVSFACAAVMLREKNMKAKSLDLLLLLVSMVLLCVGSWR